MATGHMGQVGGHIANPSASFTRPADTTAYAVGDLVANNTTAGNVDPLSFTVARAAGESWMIRRVFVRKSTTGITSAAFRVHFYTADETPANGDNGAWSTAGFDTWIGSVDVVVDKAFTDGASGVSAQIEIGRLLSPGIRTVYAYVEARGAYTPGNAEVFTVELEVIQD